MKPTRQPAGSRLLRFIRRHKHAEELAAEAIGINVAARVIGAVLAAGAASAAITVVATQQSTTYHPSFALSTKGAAFLTRNEGLRLSPYNDPFNCTWGVGHLRHYGRCATWEYGLRLTYAQAMALLMHDSGWASRCVDERVTRPITQYQADALTDLAFNAGCGSLDYSGIANQINRGDTAGVPRTLSRTAVTASGRYLPGLYTRRLAEGALFAHGYYGAGLGYYTPPKPPANPKQVPARVPAWAWRWVAWQLGRTPYKGHAGVLAYRPKTAPLPVPRWAWTFLARFTKGAR